MLPILLSNLEFIISNNLHLKTVVLKMKSVKDSMQIETLEIKDNPQLTSIKIDASKVFFGSIIISNNGNLKTLELVATTAITGNIGISGNGKLNKLTLTTNKIDSTLMEISGTLVPELDFSKITEFTMKGGWFCFFCTKR